MKPKTMILMVVAIVCGLGASYMTSQLLAERGNEKEEMPKVNVLVAKKNLDNGTPLKKPEELFEVKEFLRGQEPKDALAAYDALKDKYLKRNLRKGDFVTPKDIDENQTILPLPEGKVGVGIRVSAEAIAGGFAALPGSKVNIVWTIRGTNNLTAQSVTLLENVLVVAADTKSNRQEDGGAMPANVVTVALTEEEALKVNLAKDIGNLSLSLRSSSDDNSKGKMAKLTLKDLLNSVGKADLNPNSLVDPNGDPLPLQPVEEPQQVAEEPQPTHQRHVVWIKRGNEYQKQVFLKDSQGNMILESHAQSGLGLLAPVQAPAPTPAPEVQEPPAAPSSGPVGGKEPATEPETVQ
jgi:pilus assembly protein CpaB